MKKKIPFYYLAILCFFIFNSLSCKRAFDINPEQEVDGENAYQDIFDADAAVLGIYGKLMELAKPYVILNELRGDLMTTTTNADKYLKQISEHDVTKDNPYVDPKPFYNVILNCNDAMENFKTMLDENKLTVKEFNMRYSDVATVRSWVYLQLGIQYGEIPYVTAPLSKLSDVENKSLHSMVTLNQLIDRLIKTMNDLPYMEPYPEGTSLVTSVDGYSTNKFFINKRMFLGILYLWKGYYHKAAIQFKEVMETGGSGDLYTYRITGQHKADNNDLAVGYVRWQEENDSSLIDNNTQGWRSIFARGQDKLFNQEWIWYLPFDKNFDPEDPFTDLFSNRGGNYLVKPSQVAIGNWNNQVQKNDFPFDARGKIFTWRMLNNQPVIMKYLYNYLDGNSFLPVNIFQKEGKWFLFRAASLHLYFAEAANRDYHRSLAYALVNQGLTTIPNRRTEESFPYNFDSRKITHPTIIGDWALSAGIRGRAYLYSREVKGDSTISIENNIIKEAGLEMAYEGRRWPDLLRIALRRGDPSFLANKIYKKLVEENNPKAEAIKQKLMNKENWYLPFEWSK